jgi:hypothetical protein
MVQNSATQSIIDIVNDHLEVETIERMKWLVRSPDFNPIEHVCDVLQRQIQQQDPAPSNANELGIALIEEWNHISKRTIRSLIQSFLRRCRAFIQARGGHKKY